jgi:hypothetical protein
MYRFVASRCAITPFLKQPPTFAPSPVCIVQTDEHAQEHPGWQERIDKGTHTRDVPALVPGSRWVERRDNSAAAIRSSSFARMLKSISPEKRGFEQQSGSATLRLGGLAPLQRSVTARLIGASTEIMSHGASGTAHEDCGGRTPYFFVMIWEVALADLARLGWTLTFSPK